MPIGEYLRSRRVPHRLRRCQRQWRPIEGYNLCAADARAAEESDFQSWPPQPNRYSRAWAHPDVDDRAGAGHQSAEPSGADSSDGRLDTRGPVTDSHTRDNAGQMIAMEKRVVHHPTPQIRPQEFGGGAKSAIRRLALGMADNRVKIRKKPGLDRGS